jgi:APA family basic amino acid/polyamine antiporter
MDVLFFALTAATVFTFRSRSATVSRHVPPGHPFTTAVFIGSCLVVLIATVWNAPVDSLVGYGILLAGVPVFIYWQRKKRAAA